MHNIDFISEKWRTCRRTRRLAHIHIASSIFPILYVAVYAEAQRRDQDNKELGAALAALMFNVFQLMRTMMGYLQVSAFVAWCKYAEECIRVLQGDDHQNSVITEGRCRDEARTMMEKLGKWYNVFLSWCQCGWPRVRRFVAREGANGERRRKRDEGEYHDADADADTELNEEVTGQSVESIGASREGATESNGQRCFARTEEDDGDGIEDIIMVNNMVVDNELGGKEVTVLPSWKKILRGLKQGKFTPSKWLQTDQVILSTVRWGGAYLCSMGEGWSAHKSHSRYRYGGDAETMESFFSSEMCHIRKLLQHVEWNMYTGNDRHEYIRILPLSRQDTLERTREFSTAYGNLDFKYVISDTTTVEAYSFEFNSLVSSYPGTGDRSRKANRERVGVGLVHSVLLAQHFGVEKLKALRRYYDRYRVPQYTLRNAFELLISSIIFGISRDHLIWNLFGGLNYQIPVFPYRMQMVALWEEATNWRVLQASAHQDIFISDNWGDELQERVLENALYDYHIFDYCAEWAADLLDEGLLQMRCSAGLVMETVRSFLAEWITASVEDSNWEPDMPKESVEFETAETIGSKDFRNMTWICQRELQRKVAKKPKGEENFVGEPSLIMLLIIGFPILHVDWVNAALGFMQGYEIHDDGTYRHGRKIVEAKLSNPIVKLCPLIVNEDGIEPVVEQTSTARVWIGWPALQI